MDSCSALVCDDGLDAWDASSESMRLFEASDIAVTAAPTMYWAHTTLDLRSDRTLVHSLHHLLSLSESNCTVKEAGALSDLFLSQRRLKMVSIVLSLRGLCHTVCWTNWETRSRSFTLEQKSCARHSA